MCGRYQLCDTIRLFDLFALLCIGIGDFAYTTSHRDAALLCPAIGAPSTEAEKQYYAKSDWGLPSSAAIYY